MFSQFTAKNKLITLILSFLFINCNLLALELNNIELNENTSKEEIKKIKAIVSEIIETSEKMENDIENNFLKKKKQCYQEYFVNYCIEKAHNQKIEARREELDKREQARVILRKIKYLELNSTN